jgi:D-glycero-D-manno-heptose 1,7-bisphosphate phosphatase
MPNSVNEVNLPGSDFELATDWTIFLDRDGVINSKIQNDYVKSWDEFCFTKNATKAIRILSSNFKRIFVVTNQRGVGKGLMTEEQLNSIHKNMCSSINLNDGRIDKVYNCVALLEADENRKPNIGMGLQAKADFPEIDFSKSIIIGDSMSDMKFGKQLGMICLLIGDQKKEEFYGEFDFQFNSLFECSLFLENLISTK